MKLLESNRPLIQSTLLVLILNLLSAMTFAQTASSPPQQPVPAMVGVDTSPASEQELYNPDTSGDNMVTPPPVSGGAYSNALTSQERSNYLLGGVSFTGAYMDNALGGVNGYPISDIGYSVAPMVTLDETTSRVHTTLTYASGFTIYQRHSELNQAEQDASIQFQYRLSPHVTFSATDRFDWGSSIFNQPADFSSSGVSGGIQAPNFSIVAPVADRLSNTGNVSLSYQFGLNDMVGTSGTFSNLHYPNPSQVPGLFDSGSQGGSAFYFRRMSKTHYLGVTYAYQRLLAYQATGQNDTQTHALIVVYSFVPTSTRFSISFFGGPQYADTVQPPLPPLQLQTIETHSWTPASGASLGWQARLTSFALSYAHIISSGGGLIAAVQQNNASASARQQLTRTLNVSVAGSYAQNDVLGSLLPSNNGHSISGSAFLQQMIGQHLNIQLGYTRLHQSYGNIEAISATPDTNRESVSVSYQFSRPLGR